MPGGDQGECVCLSRPRRCHARQPSEPLALAGQVGARHPALRDPGVPLGGLRAAHGGRHVRDPVHRALSTPDLRVQRRGPAVELARLLLHLRRTRHRPLPAVHARRGARLPGALLRRLPRAPLPRPGAGQVVAPRDPALPDRGPPGREWPVRRVGHHPEQRQQRGVRLGRRPDRTAGDHRRGGAHGHRSLPAAAVRPDPRPQPVGAPGRGLRRPDDRRVPAVPPRHGRPRGRQRCCLRRGARGRPARPPAMPRPGVRAAC